MKESASNFFTENALKWIFREFSEENLEQRGHIFVGKIIFLAYLVFCHF
jgi:hypothetical protein